jgi:hypothetical protein
LGTATVYAQVWEETTPDNFEPIAESKLAVGELTPLVGIGDNLNSSLNDLNIPLTAGRRYLLILSSEAESGLTIAAATTGLVSASINVQ